MPETELSHEARELHLFLVNDYESYKAVLCPTARTLAKHWDRERYDHDKAILAMRHVAAAAAKRYTRQHCSDDAIWNRQFPVAVRNEVAIELANDLRNDLRDDERWWL